MRRNETNLVPNVLISLYAPWSLVLVYVFHKQNSAPAGPETLVWRNGFERILRLLLLLLLLKLVPLLLKLLRLLSLLRLLLPRWWRWRLLLGE